MKSPASEFSTMSTPLPAVTSRMLRGELGRPRVEHVTHAERAQQRTFRRRAGRGEHFGAGALRQLHGRHADAAGRRVDQHALAGPKLARRSRPYIAVRISRRQRRRQLERTQPFRPGREECGRHDRPRSQDCPAQSRRRGRRPRSLVTPSHRLDDAGAFGAQRRTVAGYMRSASSTSRKLMPAARRVRGPRRRAGAAGATFSQRSDSNVPSSPSRSRTVSARDARRTALQPRLQSLRAAQRRGDGRSAAQTQLGGERCRIVRRGSASRSITRMRQLGMFNGGGIRESPQPGCGRSRHGSPPQRAHRT